MQGHGHGAGEACQGCLGEQGRHQVGEAYGGGRGPAGPRAWAGAEGAGRAWLGGIERLLASVSREALSTQSHKLYRLVSSLQVYPLEFAEYSQSLSTCMRPNLPACSRSSLNKPDDGRGGAAAAGTVAPGSPQRPVAAVPGKQRRNGPSREPARRPPGPLSGDQAEDGEANSLHAMDTGMDYTHCR